MARKNPSRPKSGRKWSWKWRKASKRRTGKGTAARRASAAKGVATRKRNKAKRRAAARKAVATRRRAESQRRRKRLSGYAPRKKKRTRSGGKRLSPLQAKRWSDRRGFPFNNGPMGMPWWLLLGGAVAAYFMFFRKPAAAAPYLGPVKADPSLTEELTLEGMSNYGYF